MNSLMARYQLLRKHGISHIGALHGSKNLLSMFMYFKNKKENKEEPKYYGEPVRKENSAGLVEQEKGVGLLGKKNKKQVEANSYTDTTQGGVFLG